MSGFDWGKAITSTNKKAMVATNQNKEIETISPSNYVALARKSMGLLQRLKFDRKNKQELARDAEEIATQMLAVQRENVLQQIKFNSDIERKYILKAYQEEIYNVDSAIFRAEEEAKRNLWMYMAEQVIEMKATKKSYADQFESMVKSGQLFQEDADDLNDFIGGWTEGRKQNVSYRLQQLFKQYDDAYATTLQILKSRVM